MKKIKLCLGSTAILAVAIALFVAIEPRLSAIAGEKPSNSTEVKIDNFSFGPAVITVPVGSTVMWTNHDDVPHVVASDDNLFKSKALDTDDRFTFTFTKPGTYEYFCAIHPKMTAKVVVQ